MMKCGLKKKTDGSARNAMDKSDSGKKKRKSRRKHKKREKAKPHGGHRWHVGSHCRCVYSEDGQMYEATILSVDQEAGTCNVQYLGYGNEEEQNLKDLLLSVIYSQRTRRDTQSQSENDSMDWTSPGMNPGMTTPTSHRKPQHPGPAAGWAWPPTSPFTTGIPPPFPPIPPLFSSMPNMPCPWPGLSTSAFPGLPAMPPPPPVPPVSDDLLEADNEALSSMLMAWYMSGYHTGYYQGLKTSKKGTTSKDQTLPSQDIPQTSETG